MTSALIGWIASILFILILVGGFFVGFWRGFKRSTANLIFSVIGVIIAFFITPVITNAVLGIQVNYEGSQVQLKDLVYEMIISIGDVKQMISTNANLKTLVANLPAALFSTLIFIIVTILVEMVIYIIYKICNFAFIKGPKGGKLFGGIVGVAKTFIVTIIAFMPFAGLIGLANNLTTANDYSIRTASVQTVTEDTEGQEDETKIYSLAADQLPNEAVIVIRGLENNMLTKCSSLFGLDNAMFDYYSGVKVDGGKVHIREELQNAYDVADFGYQISKYEMKDIDFSVINYDKLLEAVNAFTGSDLFKQIISKTVYDVIVDYDKYTFIPTDSEINDILVELGTNLATVENVSTYFSSDIDKLVKTFKTVGKSGIINDVLALETNSIENLADVLISEDNVEAFEAAINNVFALNTVQDSISSVMQTVVTKVSTELDEVSINSADISENGWKEIASSITTVVKDFAEVSKIVNVGDVLADPTVLLDKTKHYDLNSLTQKIGDIIDQVRTNKLLQTADNKPVVDKMLEKNKLALPKTKLTSIDGKQVDIKTYKDLMKFVAPSLIKIRDEGIYDLATGNSTTVEKVVSLGEIVSKENNATLLADIVMPLYQIDFTRDIIVDTLTSELGTEYINLGVLNGYDEWNSDLALISNMLITLSSSTVNDTTYLELAVNNKFDKVLSSLTSTTVEGVVKPILTAKATEPLRVKLFDGLKAELDKYTNVETTISLNGVSFTGEDSQTQEVIDVLEAFVEINKINIGSIANAKHESVAALFEVMQLNAYRTVKLEGKEAEGILADAFVNLVNAYKDAYSDVVDYIEENEELCEELGVSSLAPENYVRIDFAQLIEVMDRVNGEIAG